MDRIFKTEKGTKAFNSYNYQNMQDNIPNKSKKLCKRGAKPK